MLNLHPLIFPDCHTTSHSVLPMNFLICSCRLVAYEHNLRVELEKHSSFMLFSLFSFSSCGLEGRDSLIMAPILSGITTASCSLGCVARKKSKVLPHHRCCSIGSASLNLLRETDGKEREEKEEGFEERLWVDVLYWHDPKSQVNFLFFSRMGPSCAV